MKRVNDNNLNDSSYWDEVYLKERSSGKRRIDNDRLEYLVGQMSHYKDHSPYEPDFVLLDVGCGDGELLRFVHGYLPDWKKAGTDITPKAIEFAQKDNPQMQFQVGNIYELPYPDNSFNVVFCGETIEHLDNPEGAVKELFRVCRPDGYVVISTPNEHANYSPEHIHEFTVGECIGLTSKYGDVFYEKIRVVCNGISTIWTTKKK